MSTRRVAMRAGERELRHVVTEETDGSYVTVTDGEQLRLQLTALGGGHYHAMIGERQLLVHHAVSGRTHHLHVDGDVFTFELEDGRSRSRAKQSGGYQDLTTPMPGVVSRILVEVGQEVDTNQPLYGLEAMKMETLIRTNQPGRVTKILVEAGTQVEGGAQIVELDPLEPSEPSE